jgi:hypothetical protein
MVDQEFEPPSRLNSSYSQAVIDEKFQEVTEKMDGMDSKMDSMLEILLNLKNPPSASQPSSRSVEMNTPSKQHSLMQSR